MIEIKITDLKNLTTIELENLISFLKTYVSHEKISVADNPESETVVTEPIKVKSKKTVDLPKPPTPSEPTAPPSPPEVPITPPPPPPPPPAPPKIETQKEFENVPNGSYIGLVQKISSAKNSGLLSDEELKTICLDAGLPNGAFPLLVTKPHLIPMIERMISELLNSKG